MTIYTAIIIKKKNICSIQKYCESSLNIYSEYISWFF